MVTDELSYGWNDENVDFVSESTEKKIQGFFCIYLVDFVEISSLLMD